MKPFVQKIFMVRHGKPDFPDKESYLYGHTDYALSALGREQAERTGIALADVPMDYVASSDLARAVETAKIIFSLQSRPICKHEIREDLREINMGEWDGARKDEIKNLFSDHYELRGKSLSTIAPPGGETFTELQTRAMAALSNVLENHSGAKNILLVAHGGFFWSIVCGLFGLDLDNIFAFGFDYAALHLVERRVHERDGESDNVLDPKNFRLLRYNWSPALMDSLDGLI